MWESILYTTPPTAEIALGRMEGVIAPTFEQGQTLPVIASIRTTSDSIFAGGISQTFATGDAANTMGKLFGAPDPCPNVFKEECPGVESKIRLKNDPDLDMKDDGKPRPVFFGTSTSVGIRITWAAAASPVPDSVHIGYRRKEMALAPIMKGQDDSGKGFYVAMPSLLGTIAMDEAISSPSKSTGSWMQYFATGKAATGLSLGPQVRQVMLAKMEPNYRPFFN